MSAMKIDSFCNKFQANIFNKSKCQNCFKSRELHLRTNEDLNQAKPIYGGWLCLAPEGTDFGNLAQRSRKWQRRFFILYEHGSLHFALDESPNTLPQGTVNMNLCTDVVDAETKTGQRNALCIVTPDQEFYIRGENKDIINGWSEHLVVYPLTNKQNRKKTKSKERTPVARQVPENDRPPGDKCGISSDSAQRNSGQEEDKSPRLDSDSARDQLASLPSSDSSCLGKDLPPLLSPDSLAGASHSKQDSEANTNNHADSQIVTSSQPVPASNIHASNPGARSGERRQEEPFPVPEKSEVWRSQAEVHVEDPISSSRQTRPGLQLHPTQRPKGPDTSLTPHLPERRAQSPDPRSSESVMTPDLLNFKKGWLMILEEQNQWKKNWFVLSTHKLRYYKDSVAEEASELVGEIDLTNCHQVTEHQVQRNYGFQIHTQAQVHTFAAMTAGIRRNWIQALAKNVRPSNAPDVTNPSDDPCPFGSSVGALPEPDLTRDSFSPEVSAKMRHIAKSRSSPKRREGGHGKPCGGAALRLARRMSPKGDDDEPTVEMWSVERRRRRREERRKRYESVMGSVLELGCQEEEVQVGMGTGTGPSHAHQSSHERSHQRVRGIEECWQRVEKTGVREERRVPLYPDTHAKDIGELERLLHNYKRRVEELTAQLARSSCHREEQSLDQQMNSTWDLQLENHDVQEHEEISVKMDSSPYRGHLSSLTHKYRETKELLRLEEVRRQQMQEQLSFGPSTVDQSARSCDTLMDNGQGSLASETGCPELLEHLSFTSFELLRSSSAGQVRQCPSQSERDDQVKLDVEKKLMQEVADLSHKNEALNQRNQEMVHQLTEADREIERLRAELDEREDDRLQLSALEELTSGRLEGLENELREKCLELQEVQAQLGLQSEKLRDALSQLQLREATLEGLSFLACTAKDHQSHTPLQEALEDWQEDQLDYTELHAREARGQKPSTPVMSCCQRGEVLQSQVPLDVQRTQNSKTESEEQTSDGPSPEEIGVQCLMDEIQMKSKELGSLLKGTGETDLPVLVSSMSERQDFDTNRRITDRLRQEEGIWATLVNFLKASPPLLCAEADVSHGLTAEVARARLMEIKLYLSTHKHFSSSPINSAIVSDAPDASQAQKTDGSVLRESSISEAETAELTTEVPEQQVESILSLYKRICSDSLWKELRASVNLKASLLKCIAFSLDSSVNTELRCTVQDLCSLWHRPADLELINIQAISSELLSAYIVSRLEAVQEKYVQTEAGLWGSEKSCQNCQVLRYKNEELCSRLSVMENQGSEGHNHDKEFPMDSSDSDGNQVKAVDQEVMVNPLHDDSSDQIKINMPTDLIAEVVSNRSGVEKVSLTEIPGLESQTQNKAVGPLAHVNETPEPPVWPSSGDLSVPKRMECNGNISALQEQYRRDLDNLQAVCERGFEAMEEAHQRALAELQLQHQRELDKSQQDKEQLLAEETAATVAAIEAMKKAYQEELEKALQGRHLDNSTQGKDVEEILKRHSEELCSTQRELDVLSQQYSLKCLECAHLAHALEAERHALQQCQRQYQEISVRHQELCGGLARENMLPSPLSNEAPMLQERILYELQIGLRVKRAEVECLKQEICSLREDLQTAQRDKRYATEKCTDMHKELSTTKARAQRDIDELREHLRLASKALETSSVEVHMDVGDND